jgi:uncharacterized cupredoxin-like copper-binding protein
MGLILIRGRGKMIYEMKQLFRGLFCVVMATAVSCGGNGGSGGAAGGDHAHMHTQGPAPAAAQFGEPASAADVDRTIDVKALDSLRFEPDRVTVGAGEVVRFKVTNAGRLDHEFLLGDEQSHKQQAGGMSGGGHQHSTGVFVAPGETGEVIWRFTEPGEVIFACHVNGHYSAGMEGSLIVEAP